MWNYHKNYHISCFHKIASISFEYSMKALGSLQWFEPTLMDLLIKN